MQPPVPTSIFKRGLKAELFDSSAGDTDEVILDSYLEELSTVWAAPRAGCARRAAIWPGCRRRCKRLAACCCRRDLAAGIWRPRFGAVEVLVKGKFEFVKQGASRA
jgi:hypothetical protein